MCIFKNISDIFYMKIDRVTPPSYIKIEYTSNIWDYLKDKVLIKLDEVSNRSKIRWGTFLIQIQTDPDRLLYDRDYNSEELNYNNIRGKLIRVFEQPFELGALFPYELKAGGSPYIYLSFTNSKYLLDNLKSATDLIRDNYLNNLPIFLEKLEFGVFIDPLDSGVLTFKNAERVVQIFKWLNYFNSYPKPFGLDADNVMYMSLDNNVMLVEPKSIRIKLLMSI